MMGSSIGKRQREVKPGAGTGSWAALLAGVACLFISGFAHALGLGQATVNSYLNEPLSARIDLISRSEAEMATVTAGMASSADFQVIGLTRDALGLPIEFTVSRDLADPHIRLTSSQVMNEPVLQLVVEVVWSSGRMLRQYTLFFDPPSFDAPAPLPAMPSSTGRTSDTPAVAQKPVPENTIDSSAAAVAPVISAIDTPAVETAPFEDETTAAPADTVALADTGPPFDPVTSVPETQPEPPIEESIADELPADETFSTETVPDETPLEETFAEQSGAEEDKQADIPEQSTVDNALVAMDDGTDDSAVTPEDQVLEQTPPVQEVIEQEGPDQVVVEDLDRPEDTVPALVENEVVEEAAESLPEPAATDAVVVNEEATQEPVYRAVIPQATESQAGKIPDQINVVRGDTLWDLSQDIAAARGVSVNQVMLAVQQSNPQAFLDNNINRMMAGEVLRIPQREDMLTMNVREAMLEVMRQETLYRTRWDIPTDPNDIPTISDLAQEASAEAVGPGAEPDTSLAATTSTAESGEMSLVLVPPSERDESIDEGMGQGNSGTNEVSEGISVVEELARTQEELANAQQENNYLNERISELESALERDRIDDGSGVADSNLADMEERLREDRMTSGPDPELDVNPDMDQAEAESLTSRFGLFIVGALILLIGAVVVFLRSQRNREFTGTAAGTNGDARDVAERAAMAGMTAMPEPDTEAVAMDLDDPEARLDLARAYAAMGRDEEARELLESVVQDGNAAQEREAREMLREL